MTQDGSGEGAVLDDARSRLEAQERALVELQYWLEELERSPSWRLTAPFRGLKALLIRARRRAARALAPGRSGVPSTPLATAPERARDGSGAPAGSRLRARGLPPVVTTPTGRGPALVPVLVDYFARDGSTLMMRLLASSPQIAVDSKYPYERKYFTYLWRWARLLDERKWPRDRWKVRDLGSIVQAENNELIGPPPWKPRRLFASELEERPISLSCFELVWSEFSRRAALQTGAEHDSDPAVVRYYAEKHLNSWQLDFEELPPVRILALVRDPRDTWVSIGAFNEKRGMRGLGRQAVATDEEHLMRIVGRQKRRMRWLSRLREGEAARIVRYEDLVLDLEGVARSLADWLSLSLDPGVAAADAGMRRRHVTAATPEASIGRWKHEMAPETAELFAKELGKEMRDLGFEV